MRKAARSAQAAGAPGSAAAAAAATATATPATAAATATAATTAATPGDLNAALGGSRVLFVEDVERRQTDVGDFFLTECYLMTKSNGGRLCHIRGRHGRCRCAANH